MMGLVLIISLIALIVLIVISVNGRGNLARAILSFVITIAIVIPSVICEEYIALVLAAPMLILGIYYLVTGEDINL